MDPVPTQATNCSAYAKSPKAWQWPNILSIDAALIAVVWQQWLGRTAIGPALVLGLSVWLTYTADRLLDIRGIRCETLRTERHRFASRHFRPLSILWLMLLCVNIGIAVATLTLPQFVAGLTLLCVCALYTACVYRRKRVPKELLVAIIFAAGAALFQVGPLPSPMLLCGAFILFLLAFANCSLIAFKEADIDRSLARTSLALQYPVSRNIALCGLLVAALISAYLAASMLPLYGYALASSAALLALGLKGEKLKPETFRVLADAALLLPAISLVLPQ